MTLLTKTMRDKIVKALKDGPLGNATDNLYRARAAFRGLSAAQMQEQHGQSGSTREELVRGYEDSVAEWRGAIEAIESVSVVE